MRLLRTAAVVFFLVLSVSAFADQVTFNTALTVGCFTTGSSCSAGSPTTWDPTGSGTNNAITFTGADSGNQTTVGGATTIALGTFAWGGSSDNIGSNENFIGTVTFTLPSAITGGQAETFSADITGSSSFFGLDQTLSFNFNHNSGSPLHLTFSNAGASGSFDFYVDDINMDCWFCGGDPSATWTGHIVNATQTPTGGGQVPEPGSMVLLGSGLLGLAGGLRRKLRR